MSRHKLMLLLPLCMTLTACAGSPMPFRPQSTAPTPLPAQTDQVRVTVSCGEHEPDQSLPPYPALSPDSSSSSTAQAQWAVQAAGAFQAEKTLRHFTAQCLDQLRAQHLIN